MRTRADRTRIIDQAALPYAVAVASIETWTFGARRVSARWRPGSMGAIRSVFVMFWWQTPLSSRLCVLIIS